MRRISAGVCVLIGLALLTPGCMKLKLFQRPEPAPLPQGLPIGAPAPELTGIDFDGKPLSLSEYRGKVVVVSFWTSWCGPCRRLIPHERLLAERFGDKMAMIGVNSDEDHDAARKVIASHGITWRCLQTAGMQDPIHQHWHVECFPTIYVLDSNGVVRYANVRGPAIENAIVALLAEKR